MLNIFRLLTTVLKIFRWISLCSQGRRKCLIERESTSKSELLVSHSPLKKVGMTRRRSTALAFCMGLEGSMQPFKFYNQWYTERKCVRSIQPILICVGKYFHSLWTKTIYVHDLGFSFSHIKFDIIFIDDFRYFERAREI